MLKNIDTPLKSELLPTPPLVSGGVPVLGHALAFQKDRTALFERGYKTHGDIFQISLAGKQTAVIANPDYFKLFFAETDKSLSIEKPYAFLKAMFGEALFLAPHEQYLEQRSVVQDLFRRQKMVHYLDVMQEQVQLMLDGWGNEGEVELTAATDWLVKSVAGHCLLGPEVQNQIGEEFWNLYNDLSRALDPLIPPNWPLPKFKRRDRARAKMIEILAPIIDHRRQNPDNYDDALQDIVNKATLNGKSLENEVILNLLLGLLFAGHETTAGQGAWVVILLLQNPDYLQIVKDEINSLTTVGEKFDHRTFAKLKKIAWAVRETERMRPSADMLTRVVEKEIEVGGYRIPEGWLIQTATEISHQSDDVWENPEQFDPFRYAPERAEDKQHRHALIGFGGGMHKCTGINFANTEISILVTLLFQQFDVKLVTKDPGIQRGLGANRPEETVIHYKRIA